VAEGGPLELFGIPEIRLTVSGTTAPLDQVLGPVSDAIGETGALDQVGDLLVGSLGPLDGIVAGLGGLAARGAGEPAAHVFVKFVHREAGEVVNLQEGAISVDLSGGEVTVDVPMPGLAYTIPEGDHLDVQVATNSLMHATGRVPAIVDVEVEGSLPAVGAAGAADGRRRRRGRPADGRRGRPAGATPGTATARGCTVLGRLPPPRPGPLPTGRGRLGPRAARAARRAALRAG
jgi:hypothetical protein